MLLGTVMRPLLRSIKSASSSERNARLKLSEQCNCTEVDAQKLIQEFVQEADAYLSASDVEDETLRQIILRKPDLEKRCKELLAREWAEDNDEKLREAENFLQQKKDEAEKAKTQFDQLMQRIYR